MAEEGSGYVERRISSGLTPFLACLFELMSALNTQTDLNYM